MGKVGQKSNVCALCRQFRVDSDKTMVYDHVTRVPFLIKGPGVENARHFLRYHLIASPTKYHLFTKTGSGQT